MKIINNQSKWQTCDRQIKALAKHLLARADRLVGQRQPRELSIILMDDGGIAEVNQAILGHRGPTDVITVRYRPVPGEAVASGDVGELYVNVDRAVQVAQARGRWSEGRELALYIAHGCDHLTGEDDATSSERKRMRRRELRWLRKAEEAGYRLEDLIRMSNEHGDNG